MLPNRDGGLLRNGIVTGGMKRVALYHSSHRIPPSYPHAVPLQRLKGILGTGRIKPAMPIGLAQWPVVRRNGFLVYFDAETKKVHPLPLQPLIYLCKNCSRSHSVMLIVTVTLLKINVWGDECAEIGETPETLSGLPD